MKTKVLCIVFVVLAAVGCAANPLHPTLNPISQQWKKVPHEMGAPVVLKVPGAEQVLTASAVYAPGRGMDIYYPGNFNFEKPAPVVIFVMGYSSDFTMNWFGAKLKDLGQYVSWGELVATQGMIGVTYETAYPDDDIDAVLDYIIAKASWLGMDAKRIALFACSGNTMTALGALAAKNADYRTSLRCGVIFYPVISYFMNKGDQVMPAPFKRELRRDLPIFMVTIGKERPEWKEAVSTFLSDAKRKGYPIEVAGYEAGIHGFDTDQDTDESRALIAHALQFMKDKLKD